jgi:hypothetical protein
MPPIIRSLKWHCQPLVFIRVRLFGRVVGGRAWQRPPTTRPNNLSRMKTRGWQCRFRLLMMGGVSPETCWASYKYRIIKFWYFVASCWIFLYEFYYDARIHKRHKMCRLWRISNKTCTQFDRLETAHRLQTNVSIRTSSDNCAFGGG